MNAIDFRLTTDRIMAILFPKDKAVHLIIGIHVFVMSMILGTGADEALIIAGIVGILIEVTQKALNIGEAGWLDAVYVLYGGLLPYIAIYPDKVTQYLPWLAI